jgi:triosephosphate isomerase
MVRKLFIAANLKMNHVPQGALVDDSPYGERPDVDVVMFSNYFDLHKCIGAGLITGAQYGRAEPEGAFTGDVNMQMIAGLGARYVLCGHSERREYHKETNEQVLEQAKAAIKANLHPIVCVGETAEERRQERQEEVVEKQVAGLPLDSEGITIAYEPVWAIGKKALRAATPSEAQEMHAFIRSLVDADRRDTISIIYGGSLNPGNAAALLEQPDIDGGLVGGASLKPDEFRQIVDIAVQLAHTQSSRDAG